MTHLDPMLEWDLAADIILYSSSAKGGSKPHESDTNLLLKETISLYRSFDIGGTSVAKGSPNSSEEQAFALNLSTRECA